MAYNPNFDNDVRKHRLQAIKDALESYGELISHALRELELEGRVEMTVDSYAFKPDDRAMELLIAADKSAKRAFNHASIALEVESWVNPATP